jgi:hypothetical protein
MSNVVSSEAPTAEWADSDEWRGGPLAAPLFLIASVMCWLPLLLTGGWVWLWSVARELFASRNSTPPRGRRRARQRVG